MIAASGSGQGKTIFTAALARYHCNRGSAVKVIKLGPDFLDPMILEIASGQTVHNLDWWMMGEAHCRRLFDDAVRQNDVVLIESLMGLHDQVPSSAWLARELGVPVLLVMNLSKLAQTAAAFVHGMQRYAGGAPVESVVGNRIGSERHHDIVKAAMPEDVQYRGSLREDPAFAIPVRHLGLVQGSELAALSGQLDRAADQLVDAGLALELPMLASGEPPVASPDRGRHDGTPSITVSDRAARSQNIAPYPDEPGQGPSTKVVSRPLTGRIIAIARDDAFSFIYPANVRTLEDLGASCVFFSPLADQPLPPCDALWLPGGYPELHLEQLSAGGETQRSIIEHVKAAKPGLAECGGMMYLGSGITSVDSEQRELCGVFDAHFTMQRRFQSVGHQWLDARLTTGKDIAGNLSGSEEAAAAHGHSFHHSILQTDVPSVGCWRKRDGMPGEAHWQVSRMTLTYVHHYFAQHAKNTARMFGAPS